MACTSDETYSSNEAASAIMRAAGSLGFAKNILGYYCRLRIWHVGMYVKVSLLVKASGKCGSYRGSAITSRDQVSVWLVCSNGVTYNSTCSCKSSNETFQRRVREEGVPGRSEIDKF